MDKDIDNNTIILSNLLYIFLVLLIKKSSSSIYIDINYYILNTRIVKNRYSILLIKEILKDYYNSKLLILV